MQPPSCHAAAIARIVETCFVMAAPLLHARCHRSMRMSCTREFATCYSQSDSGDERARGCTRSVRTVSVPTKCVGACDAHGGTCSHAPSMPERSFDDLHARSRLAAVIGRGKRAPFELQVDCKCP